MRALLLRPTHVVGLIFATTLMLALATLALFGWSDLQRTELVRSHVNRTFLLEETSGLVKDALLEVALGGRAPSPARLAAARANLEQLPVRGGPIGEYTRTRLARLHALLDDSGQEPRQSLQAALAMLREMLTRESRIQLDLLDTALADARLEWKLTLAGVIAFPCMVALGLWMLRAQILRPITNLRGLLSRLADGEFTPVQLAPGDPLLRPLFENFNHMVERMQQLEQTNQQRRASLEQEVRSATQALLRQQQTLARAERLAAVGEMAAGLAHEMRNPIAGIEVTLANLRQELPDPELSRRIDLVIGELHRMTRLLNGILDQSRHTPEPARTLQLGEVLEELATLVRYQLPANVRLETQLPSGLACALPEDGLRQAVLNLILNAVEAIGETPGLVSLRVQRSGDMVELAVTDDGPGFPDLARAGAGRPFSTGRSGGTGLGLAMVRRFVSDLGGDLQLHGRAPHGACVMLRMPCTPHG